MPWDACYVNNVNNIVDRMQCQKTLHSISHFLFIRRFIKKHYLYRPIIIIVVIVSHPSRCKKERVINEELMMEIIL